jgi:hypothetical protein
LFLADSGITINGDVTATQYSGSFTTSDDEISNTVVDDDDAGDYIILSGAVSGSYQHEFTLDPITNAPVAKLVSNGIQCIACNDADCSSSMEETYANLLQFEANLLLASAVTITSDYVTTGTSGVTISVQIELANPLVANGAIRIEMPKRNINHADLNWQYPESFWDASSTIEVTQCDSICSSTSSISSDIV